MTAQQRTIIYEYKETKHVTKICHELYKGHVFGLQTIRHWKQRDNTNTKNRKIHLCEKEYGSSDKIARTEINMLVYLNKQTNRPSSGAKFGWWNITSPSDDLVDRAALDLHLSDVQFQFAGPPTALVELFEIFLSSSRRIPE